MKIIWAMNPLKTVVELDDADKRYLRERIKTELLEDRITSASLTLDPKHQAWLAERGHGLTSEQVLDAARGHLDLAYLFDAERGPDGQTFDEYLDLRLARYVAGLAEDHEGDCVCVPCSCMKCHAESLIGINTIAGLGKHSASKIGHAFRGGASIDQAVQRLVTYRPIWEPGRGWNSREDFERHVPRWIEEGKRALEWLVAYRDEHWATPKRSETK